MNTTPEQRAELLAKIPAGFTARRQRILTLIANLKATEQERDDERNRADENLAAAKVWRAAAEGAQAERDRHGPCICNTGPGTEGPDEYCPRHGRTYDDALDVADRIIDGARAETDAAQTELKRLRDGIEALADEWQFGEWANAPRRSDRIAERLAMAQYVTDWLRGRVGALLNGEEDA
jgi:hypothetical protein